MNGYQKMYMDKYGGICELVTVSKRLPAKEEMILPASTNRVFMAVQLYASEGNTYLYFGEGITEFINTIQTSGVARHIYSRPEEMALINQPVWALTDASVGWITVQTGVIRS